MGPPPPGTLSQHQAARMKLLQQGGARGFNDISFYSLAASVGGVCIDMVSGAVRFDWDYVPFGEAPADLATYVRRTHFRNGQHSDDSVAAIVVPERPSESPGERVGH